MWPGDISRKYGSSSYAVIGGNNQIAFFASPVHGAAAAFEMLANSPNYANKPINQIISTWSGNTGGLANVKAYVNRVTKAVGLDPTSTLSPEFSQSPGGISFLKEMARQEAGLDEYPNMTDQYWQRAQRMAFPQ
jgi:hypothetical protein